MFAVGLLGETGLEGFDFSFRNILSRLPEVISAAATGYVTGGAWGAVTGTGTAALVKPSSKNLFTEVLTGAGLGAGAGSVTGAALAVGGYSGDKGLVGNAVGNWLNPPPLTSGSTPSSGAPLTQAPVPSAAKTIGGVVAAASPFLEPTEIHPGAGAYPATAIATYPGAPGGSPYYQQEALGGRVSPILIVGALGVAILIAVISTRGR